ncbi:lantibiotic dehydratase [Nucisporomicrobium flavum]|uniref:lantibiotic dehydratase n=1 Tax=Nucisporomicrobium flavum TaxID=2785915 RepID=UPI003C2D2CE2
MPLDVRPYQPAGPMLVRASTLPTDSVALGEAPTGVDDGLVWLVQQWSRPDLREAVTMASPSLAARVTQIIDDGATASPKAVRRAVLATASYLARWQRRPTPFGLFAGISVATTGSATCRVGDQHTAVARADADWLTRVVDRLERQHDLRQHLMVVADNTAIVRGGRVIVAARPAAGERQPGPARDVSTRFTRAVQAALTCAARPVLFTQLATHLTDQLPHASPQQVDALLHGLLDGGFLITNLRPPMTADDGLAHVIDVLHATDAPRLSEPAAVLEQLEAIRGHLRRHNAACTPQEQATIRATVAEAMTALSPGSEYPLAVDVRLDADVRIPAGVVNEAAQAAGALVRLTTQPFGSAAWLDYHTRFRDRYGPGALVPVKDLVADSGLGYPHGYLDAPRARPAWRMVTERDAYLLALIQQAMLDGADEITLTDADIDALTIGDPTAAAPPARVELALTVEAASVQALNEGTFVLRVTGAPRAYTSMAGRFAHLLNPATREQWTRSYTDTATADARELPVLLSFPPRRVHNQNVTRVGRLAAHVVSLGEHPDGEAIDVDDLAVTADPDQLHLVQRSTGRRLVASIPHALDTTVQTPPLARFIAEVAHARTAVFGPFDFGAAARTLPYTPRIRYQRTILAPARWTLTTADLTPLDETAAARARAAVTIGAPTCWEEALRRWRQRWHVPARVIACHGELRLPLDLDQPLDRALLHHRLTRTERLEIREDAPADAHHWLARPAELLIPLTLRTPTARRLPVTAAPGRPLRPGSSSIVRAHLIGNPARFDELLTHHLPAFADSLTDQGVLRWWIRRHRDMIRLDADHYLSLVLRLSDPGAFAAVAARLAAFTDTLHQTGLPADLVLAPHHEHPARYGHGPALDAAEHVFAADTTAAITQLRLSEHAGLPSHVLAAISMARLAAGFAPTPACGHHALLACLRGHTQPADRALTDLTRALAHPARDEQRLGDLPGGDAVTTAWQDRDEALRAYHAPLAEQRDPATVLRTLLHEHHVRAVGVDPDFERTTNHLARAVAMSSLNQASIR